MSASMQFHRHGNDDATMSSPATPATTRCAAARARTRCNGSFSNDVLIVAEGDYVAGETYDGGDGTDTLRYTGTSDIDFSGATITAIEGLVSASSATISLTTAQLLNIGYIDANVRLTDGGYIQLNGVQFQARAPVSGGYHQFHRPEQRDRFVCCRPSMAATRATRSSAATARSTRSTAATATTSSTARAATTGCTAARATTRIYVNGTGGPGLRECRRRRGPSVYATSPSYTLGANLGELTCSA